MADGMRQGSHYVKLTKEQAFVDEIKPGELNQPIRPSEFVVPKCLECGQSLPESYEPPADEPWSTGIFGCTEDIESLWKGLLCPCILFGENFERVRDDDTPWTTPCLFHAVFVEGGMALALVTSMIHGIDPNTSFLIFEGLFFTWWMCGIYSGLGRQTLQRKYHLEDSPCDPCLVHCCLHWCALCQEHREMRARLSDDAIVALTVSNAPAIQQMSSYPDNKNQQKLITERSFSSVDEGTGLELQPV